MFFHIHPSNGVPVYEQIARQIMFAVASGGIVPGELVPSVRNLSRELAVNPNTVARAYRQLQDAGILETVRGEGMLVTAEAPRQCRADRQRLIGNRIESALLEARQSQLTESEIKTLVQAGMDRSKSLLNEQYPQERPDERH